MKIYAKGCDAPGCASEAEVDPNTGRPTKWCFVSLSGDNLPQRSVVVCPGCLKASGVLAWFPLSVPLPAKVRP